MKKFSKLLFVSVCIFIMSSVVSFAHPGPLDSKGGHYDKYGGYHYHVDINFTENSIGIPDNIEYGDYAYKVGDTTISLYKPKNTYEKNATFNLPDLKAGMNLKADTYNINFDGQVFKETIYKNNNVTYLPVDTLVSKNKYPIRTTHDGKSTLVYSPYNIFMLVENTGLLATIPVNGDIMYDSHNIVTGSLKANNTIFSVNFYDNPIVKINNRLYIPLDMMRIVLDPPDSDIPDDYGIVENTKNKTIKIKSDNSTSLFEGNQQNINKILDAMITLGINNNFSKKELLDNYNLNYNFDDVYYNLNLIQQKIGNTYIVLEKNANAISLTTEQNIVLPKGTKLKLSIIDYDWILYCEDSNGNAYEMIN